MIALALLLAAAPATPAAAAPSGYAMVRCIDVSKGDEYRDYMLEVTARTMQVRANEGDIAGWVFARSVMPAARSVDLRLHADQRLLVLSLPSAAPSTPIW